MKTAYIKKILIIKVKHCHSRQQEQKSRCAQVQMNQSLQIQTEQKSIAAYLQMVGFCRNCLRSQPLQGQILEDQYIPSHQLQGLILLDQYIPSSSGSTMVIAMKGFPFRRRKCNLFTALLAITFCLHFHFTLNIGFVFLVSAGAHSSVFWRSGVCAAGWSTGILMLHMESRIVPGKEAPCCYSIIHNRKSLLKLNSEKKSGEYTF